jgi:hypothetical protein
MELSALPAFTALQHLDLGAHTWDSTISAVPAAIPNLQHLTHLGLTGRYADDAVLPGVQHLPKLEQLLVKTDRQSRCTATSFAALPVSLTKLCINDANNLSRQPIRVSLNNTPGITQLTALQWLEVSGVEFDMALLASLQSLHHLAITVALAPVGVQGAGLTVLSSLTVLQHLQLTPHIVPDQPTPADIAALTASSQLTYLDIGSGIARGQYSHMFPAGRQLPHLRGLRATMGLLAGYQDTTSLGRCCPNLQHLELSHLGTQASSACSQAGRALPTAPRCNAC